MSQLVTPIEQPFTKKRTDVGVCLYCCEAPSIGDEARSVDLVEQVSELVQHFSHSLFCFTTVFPIKDQFYQTACKSLARSLHMRAVIVHREPGLLFFRKDAWSSLASVLSKSYHPADLITDFASKATEHRRFPFIELDDTPTLAATEDTAADGAPSEQSLQDSSSLSQNNFYAANLLFRCSDKEECAVIEDQSLWEDSKAIPLFQGAVDMLNADRAYEALTILTQLLSVRRDIAVDLLYPKAIAEIKLGRFYDAIRSLIALIERVPEHAQARELLAQVEDAVKQTEAG